MKESVNMEEEKIQFQKKMIYPVSQDIYNQSEQLSEIDPENITALKDPNEEEQDEEEERNEKDFEEDFSGEDLDIPGAELDDADEAIGNEDEENNGYSIGGDRHNDLDEDRGG
jgi:hypothetical protein